MLEIGAERARSAQVEMTVLARVKRRQVIKTQSIANQTRALAALTVVRGTNPFATNVVLLYHGVNLTRVVSVPMATVMEEPTRGFDKESPCGISTYVAPVSRRRGCKAGGN